MQPVPQDRKVSKDLLAQPVLPALLVPQVQRVLQVLKDQQVRLEQLVLPDQPVLQEITSQDLTLRLVQPTHWLSVIRTRL